MVAFRSQLVPLDRAAKNIGANPNARKRLCVHLTGNTGRGANAQAHANLQSRPNPRVASWHYEVDDTVVIQSFPHSVRCFHAGTALGNREAISFEGCVNIDGDYGQMLRNLAYAVAVVMREEGLTISDVVQHHHYSGKDCPDMIRAGRDGVTWAAFLTLVATFHARGVTRTSGGTAPVPTYHPITVEQMEMLAALGYYDGQLDGVPGPMTEAAVIGFQRDHGLVPDGLIGPITLPVLTRAFQALPPLTLEASMYRIANQVPGDKRQGTWYVVIPNGTGKPTAVILGKQDAFEGTPLLRVGWSSTLERLRQIIDGLG